MDKERERGRGMDRGRERGRGKEWEEVGTERA